MDREAKARRLERLRQIVNAPGTVPGALAAMNMVDVYLNIADREQVLSTLQRRYPDATGQLEGADDWAAKLASLSSSRTYVSGYAGQVGEDRAVDALAQLGVEARAFPSRVHPDDDLIDTEGLTYSVKSYGSLSNFRSVVAEHPGSTRYVVNRELYDQLESAGEIDSLAARGVQVIDGGFSHQEAVDLASQRLDAINGDIVDEVGDSVFDDVPVVAGIVAICNIGVSAYRYGQGKDSASEAIANVLGYLGRAAAATGGAAAGAAAGAAIGSAVFPLAGTLIGGGVGAFLGGIGARGVAADFVASWRHGDSLRAFSYFGQKYSDGWPDPMVDSIVEKFFRRRAIRARLAAEESRRASESAALDPNAPTPPTMVAVLVDETVGALRRSLDVIGAAGQELHDDLVKMCIEIGLARYPRRRDVARDYAVGVLGAVVAENSTWLLNPDPREAELLAAMRAEFIGYPNNPYRLARPKEEILGAIAMKTLSRVGKEPNGKVR